MVTKVHRDRSRGPAFRQFSHPGAADCGHLLRAFADERLQWIRKIHGVMPVQVHACAAGFFRRTSVAQLICLDVSDTYILVGIGDAMNAAALAPHMQSLPQVHAL